jgi:hypothetical protein
VREQRAKVYVARPAGQCAEIFGIGLPVPGQPFGHHRARNILDALHHRDQQFLVARAAGRESDAAIAADRGGDAMRR